MASSEIKTERNCTSGIKTEGNCSNMYAATAKKHFALHQFVTVRSPSNTVTGVVFANVRNSRVSYMQAEVTAASNGQPAARGQQPTAIAKPLLVSAEALAAMTILPTLVSPLRSAKHLAHLWHLSALCHLSHITHAACQLGTLHNLL